jgi:hypothetical protein
MACFVRRRLLPLIARQLARLVGTQTTFPFSLSHDKMVDMAGTLSDTAWYEEEDEEDGEDEGEGRDPCKRWQPRTRQGRRARPQ